MVANSSKPEFDLPDNCPNCQSEIFDRGTVRSYKIESGESSHGDFLEVRCTGCDIALQRKYESEDVSLQDDPLVNPAPWVHRAELLRMETTLKQREAQVQALKETGMTHAQVGEKLGISESTVGEYMRRIVDRIDKSGRTLDEINHSVDVLPLMAKQFEDWVVFPFSEAPCRGCGTRLEKGDKAVVAAERVSEQWKSIDAFCMDCSQDGYMTHQLGPEHTLTQRFMDSGNFSITSVWVEGTLDARGEKGKENPHTLENPESLVLREPHLKEIWN